MISNEFYYINEYSNQYYSYIFYYHQETYFIHPSKSKINYNPYNQIESTIKLSNKQYTKIDYININDNLIKLLVSKDKEIRIIGIELLEKQLKHENKKTSI